MTLDSSRRASKGTTGGTLLARLAHRRRAPTRRGARRSPRLIEVRALHANPLGRAEAGKISTDRILHPRAQSLSLASKSRRGKPTERAASRGSALDAPGEAQKLTVRGPRAMEQPFEMRLRFRFQHGERGEKLLPPSGFAALRELSSGGQAAVDRGVPEDSIAVSQELLVNRAFLRGRHIPLVIEGGVQHVLDVEKLTAERRCDLLEAQKRMRRQLDRERRHRPAAVMEVRTLVAGPAGQKDEASRH